MKKLILGSLATFVLVAGLSTMAEAKVTIYFGIPYYDRQIGPDYLYDRNYGWYQRDYRFGNRWNNGNQDLVCLVTFFRRDQVSAGADINVQRARLLPIRVAQRMDRPNDRNRIFDYGSNRKTRQTCRYLDNINS
jgi:hypothetical protein